MNKTFGVIGGDRRQAELARLLTADGNTVFTYGLERYDAPGAVSLEQVAQTKTVILPLPLCREPGLLNCEGTALTIAELFACLKPEQRVLAGQIQPQQYGEAEQRGITLEDYFLREELTVANAAITAENAIQVAMERLDGTLLGMPCLVLGFGRIGKLLCHRLHGLGARVTATARRPEDLAWIRAYGWPALESGALDGQLDGFGVVFNTIPTLILDAPLLSQLPEDCLCVELASQPGIDLTAAQELGLPQVWARALPGQLAPRAAAAAIRDTVYRMLSENP